jgi:nitroreductase
LALTNDQLLSTTRSVRLRLDLDRPVELDVVADCVRLAMQAPLGAGRPGPRWVVVTDPAQRVAVADVYRSAMDRGRTEERARAAEDVRMRRLFEGALHLEDNLEHVPVLVLPCIAGRPEPSWEIAQLGAHYGSVLPAVWSFMLALRSRGLVSCWTSAHLRREAEMARVLGIPESYTQVALIPVAHTVGGQFHPARREPLEEVMYLDRWQA